MGPTCRTRLKKSDLTLNPRYTVLAIALTLIVGLAACGSQEVETNFEDLPAGDAERGAELYDVSINLAPTCLNCHQLDEQALGGPGLGGYAQLAGERVEGQSAEEYTYLAIVDPGDYLTPGWNNVMYARYGDRLSDQEIADLIAYLLTLE